MQIRDFWLTFSKRWWLILIVAAASCAASYGYARLQTPIYRAEVQMTVAPSRLDYGLTLVIENFLTQYQQQLQTRQLAGSVDDTLKLDRPVDSLLGEVKVSAITNGYLLAVTVDDTDPNVARDISLVWAQKFIEQHQAEMAPLDPHDRINIKMLDKPIAGSLFFPKTKQLVLAAGVLGLVVGAVLTFVLEYLDDTLKTPDDVERVMKLPVVGSIPIATALVKAGPKANGRARGALVGERKG